MYIYIYVYLCIPIYTYVYLCIPMYIQIGCTSWNQQAEVTPQLSRTWSNLDISIDKNRPRLADVSTSVCLASTSPSWGLGTKQLME